MCDGRRLASMKTNRRDDGQLDVLFTGAECTHFHFFAEPQEDDRHKFGGILTDRGEKPEPSAGTRSSTEAQTGCVGRLRVREGGKECDFALNYGESALTASAVETLDPSTRKAVELPGDVSEEATFAIDYSLGKPREPNDGVPVQGATGNPEVWFSIHRISSSTGTM